MEMALQHRIRERAYEIWNAAGRIHGQAEQHWFAAEREILAQRTAPAPAKQSATAHKTVRQRRPLTKCKRSQRKQPTRADADVLDGERGVTFGPRCHPSLRKLACSE